MPEAGSERTVRKHVIYSGRVQGVFFRATSEELAREFRVVGYVRNRPDGTVELETQGPPEEVDSFLTAIGRHFKHNITRSQVQDRPASGDETTFEIRY